MKNKKKELKMNKESITQKFINRVVQILEDENRGKQNYNIPFIIAPLKQHLQNCTELINDIKNNDEYDLHLIYKSNYGHLSQLVICFYNESLNNRMERTSFYYTIDFLYKPREYSDRDKQHISLLFDNYTWNSPSYSIKKICDYGCHPWKGDKYSYYEFNNKFITSELTAQKELERKEEMRLLEDKINSNTVLNYWNGLSELL